MAKSIWITGIRDLAFADDETDAVMRSLQSLHLHALPLEEVPRCVSTLFHTLLFLLRL